MSRSNQVNMAFVSSYKIYPLALLVLFFVSSDIYNGIHGLETKKKIPPTNLVVINHDHCQSCPVGVSSLKDVHTYSELKYDPRASLPSSFTICVSVLVTTENLYPSFLSVSGNDWNPWFSAQIAANSFFGRQFYYPTNLFVITNGQKLTQCECFPDSGFEAVPHWTQCLGWFNGWHEGSLWTTALLLGLQIMFRQIYAAKSF